MPINQPMNQIRLTNISLVRLKKNGTRFEIPCYKNKVLDYRSGADTDLDNILQIPQVFLNVAKGQVAPKDQLAKAFGYLNEQDQDGDKNKKGRNAKKGGKSGGGRKHKHGKHSKGQDLDDEEEELEEVDVEAVIREILDKGEMQVGEKERRSELERTEREVIELVAGMCVDTKSGRVFSAGIIEKALAELSKEGGRGRPDDVTHRQDKGSGGSESGSSKIAEGMQKLDVDDDADGEKDENQPQTRERVPIWTGVTTTKSAKSQALDAIRALVHHQPLPIARARMRLRIECPKAIAKEPVKNAPAPHDTKNADGNAEDATEQRETMTVREAVLSHIEEIQSQGSAEGSSDWHVIGFVEPGAFRVLMELMNRSTKGQGRLEVLDMAVIKEGGR